MTLTEKEIGYAVSGCLNYCSDVTEITRDMIANMVFIFSKNKKDVDRKKVVKFVEAQVVHLI